METVRHDPEQARVAGQIWSDQPAEVTVLSVSHVTKLRSDAIKPPLDRFDPPIKPINRSLRRAGDLFENRDSGRLVICGWRFRHVRALLRRHLLGAPALSSAAFASTSSTM